MSNNIPSTQAEINGYTWTIYADTTKETIEQIVRLSKALARAGYTAPKKSSGWAGGKRPDDRVEPAYDTGGNPICPVHGKRLNEREWNGSKFWSCPAKADTSKGEKASPKGYCDIRFRR